MSARQYRLSPRRLAGAERTRSRILAAAREVVAELGPAASVGKLAERAGVSRITVYNQFGSKAGLLDALSAGAGRPSPSEPPEETAADPADALRRRIEMACAAWASDPRLYRQLAVRSEGGRPDQERALAEKFAAADRLRPGCSIKEAEDVLGILTSFPVFDRLHKEGRRSPSAVAAILLRMASGTITMRSRV